MRHDRSLQRVWFCVLLLVGLPARLHAQHPPTAGAAGPAYEAYPQAPGVYLPYPYADPALIYESNLEAQLKLRQAERRELMHAGRPSYYLRRRALGFTAIGLGAAGLAFASTILFFHRITGGSLSMTDAQRAGVWTAGLGGAVSVGVGVWAVKSAKRDNLHRDRIDTLGHEQEALLRQIKALRRERQRRGELSLSPGLSLDAGGRVMLHAALRL